MPQITQGDVHIASLNTDTFTTIALLTGDTPPVVTQHEVTTVALAQYQVVGRNAGGTIVPAVLGTVEAIGITVNAIDPAVGTVDSVAVYRAGCFNPKALVWDATYDTDQKKKVAFEAKGNPIFMLAPK